MYGYWPEKLVISRTRKSGKLGVCLIVGLSLTNTKNASIKPTLANRKRTEKKHRLRRVYKEAKEANV